MIFPSKHINIAESLLGLSSFILELLLSTPKTIEQIWIEYEKINNSESFPAYHGFDHIVLAIDYLFLIGTININNKEEIYAIT